MTAATRIDPHRAFNRPNDRRTRWIEVKHSIATCLGLVGSLLLTPNSLGSPAVRRSLWRRGIAAQPKGFYSSMVDPADVVPSQEPHLCPCLEMDAECHLNYLRSVFPKYSDEYAGLDIERGETWNRSPRFYKRNDAFQNMDAFAYWAIIREHRPSRVVEIGSGFSTLLAAQAVIENSFGRITAIDPYPREFIRRNDLGIDLVTEPAEDTDPELLLSLRRGDIVFVDSTHVVRQGGDVNWFFLSVLPRLNPGVLVHVHDVYLPFDYPVELMQLRNVYWTEQYLLQSYLTHNVRSKVLFGSRFAAHAFPDETARAFHGVDALSGASFWISA